MRPQRGALQRLAGFRGELQLVAHIRQRLEKLCLRQGRRYSPVDVGADETAVGGLAVFLRRPRAVVFAPALWTANDRETVFPAQSIRDLAHPGVITIGAVELLAVHKGDCIDDKVRVDVGLLIHMGRHQHLISFAPQLLGQLNADTVRLFRCDLALPKRLIAVISDCPVFLTEPLFHGYHFAAGRPGGAVYAGDQLPSIGRGLAAGVGDHVLQRFAGGLRSGRDRLGGCGLVRILGIEERLADVTADTPQGCYCHEPYITSNNSWIVFFK